MTDTKKIATKIYNLHEKLLTSVKEDDNFRKIVFNYIDKDFPGMEENEKERCADTIDILSLDKRISKDKSQS